MRKVFALLMLSLLPASFVAQVEETAPSQWLVVKHVTVIDVKGARPIPDKTLTNLYDRLVAAVKGRLAPSFACLRRSHFLHLRP